VVEKQLYRSEKAEVEQIICLIKGLMGAITAKDMHVNEDEVSRERGCRVKRK